MAQQDDDKSHLMTTGIFVLVVIVSGLWAYQEFGLKSSRPIDKNIPKKVALGKDWAQARLWQDPFEAIELHQLKNAEQLKQLKEAGLNGAERNLRDKPHEFINALKAIKQSIKRSGVPSNFRVIPVFVDGNPYASGAESRLNDRYAVVSALGAAGYMPESGEYIRFFTWQRKSEQRHSEPPLTIPLELFIPKAKIRDENAKHVLILWLKDQEFNPEPLASLNQLIADLDKVFDTKPVYQVLGPRTFGTLSAMLKELDELNKLKHDKHLYNKHYDKHFKKLKDLKIYSPWATAEDAFLLDYPPDKEPTETIKELFENAKIDLFRMTGTDAALAEQLIKEMKRRRVPFKNCPKNDCNLNIALISEWDTLSGRAVPRTFAAVAMNAGSDKAGLELESLKSEINKLRKDKWPDWVHRYSYLTGLDGELPAKESGKETGGTLAKVVGSSQRSIEQNMRELELPEGRSQLDYIRRLATVLEQEEARLDKKFDAIGVLGSDVYDKLLVLQALRNIFPRAIFFTTDLNASLAEPSQWQWTRNVIVASHFGLALHRDLQTPIPPFRDSYQTALFYAASRALEHFEFPNGKTYLQVKMDEDGKTFAKNADPRLYEIGRHGPVDISPDQSGVNASIHPPRPDLAHFSNGWRTFVQVVWAIATFIAIYWFVRLHSKNTFTKFDDFLDWLKLNKNKFDLLKIIIAGLVPIAAAWLIWHRAGTEDEPLVQPKGLAYGQQ